MKEESQQSSINNYIRKDPFADYLGATYEIIEPGHSRVSLTVTPEMANFHGTTHGSVIFAIGDMAFGAASNACGQSAFALNMNIIFLKASRPGDRLVAEAKEQHVGGKTALYEITIHEERSGELIAKSRDLAYRKREWFVPPSEKDTPDRNAVDYSETS